jgi:transposase-like protein
MSDTNGEASRYQLLPSHTPEEYEALKADIALNGIMLPVEEDDEGNLLDGHHRRQIAAELGIPCPVRVVPLKTDAEKRAHALRVNTARRQLSPEQSREVRLLKRRVAAELRDEGLSQEQVAERLGVTRQAVSLWLGSIASACNALHTEGYYDLRIKLPRPARQAIVRDVQAGKSVAQVAALFHVTPQRVYQIIKKAGRDAARAADVPTSPGEAVVFDVGWRDFLAGPCVEADLLFTDPPYMTDLDEDVHAFAATWLPPALARVKDSGRAYVFTGAYPEELHAYLDVFLSQERFILGNVLVWTYRNTLGPAPARDYKLNWQACFYLRGPAAPGLNCPALAERFSVHDVNAPDARTGVRRHEWEKPEALALRLMRHALSGPSPVVIDPFAGTGTFLAVAASLGARALGSEIDPAMLALCGQRGVTLGHA